jgi:hypothetical protein
MGHSTVITDYLGYGLAAARPATPNIPTGCMAWWWSTDTGVLSVWNGSTWSTSSFSTLPDGQLVANISGGVALPTGVSFTAFLDHVISATEGELIARTHTGWAGLGVGTNGQVLQAVTTGTGVAPQWVTPTPRYILKTFVPGKLTGANQVVLFTQTEEAITLPANGGATGSGASSVATCSASCTGSTVYTLQKCLAANDPTNNSNWVNEGTITWSASGYQGTYSTSGVAVAFAQFDYLRVLGPATPDATQSGVALGLAFNG